MNREKIQIMIDTFKRLHHAPLPEHPDKGFNMASVRPIKPANGYTQHGCGTAACIKGWYSYLFNTRGDPLEIFKDGSDSCPYGALHAPRPLSGCRISFSESPEKFTLEAAITVLERLRDTGEVDWNYAIDNPWSPEGEAYEQEPISIMDMLMTKEPKIPLLEGPKRTKGVSA